MINNIIGLISMILLLSCTSKEKSNINEKNTQKNLVGESLFLSNCTSCHHNDMLTDMTGPALGLTVFKRDKNWWVRATKNFGSLIKERDSTAIKLYVEYKNVVMQNFEDLSEKEILAIYEYVKWKTKKVKPELAK